MNPKNPYENRWRWWYPAIADAMLRNPDYSQEKIARELGKTPVTISMIVNTDLFRDYFAQRRKDWERTHDASLVQKTMKVASSALDILAESMEKKRDSIPIGQLTQIATSALDRLGYSPNKPAAPAGGLTVNAQNAQLVMPVSADQLREAQDAIRLAQSRRVAPIPVLPEPQTVEVLREESLDFSALDDHGELPSDEAGSAGGLPRVMSSD